MHEAVARTHDAATVSRTSSCGREPRGPDYRKADDAIGIECSEWSAVDRRHRTAVDPLRPVDGQSCKARYSKLDGHSVPPLDSIEAVEGSRDRNGL